MANSKNAPASDIAAPQFFALNARYTVAPDATAGELLNDAGCFLESVHQTLLSLAMELTDRRSTVSTNSEATAAMLFGASYLTEMARSAVEAAKRHDGSGLLL